jgi:hypothetical protein
MRCRMKSRCTAVVVTVVISLYLQLSNLHDLGIADITFRDLNDTRCLIEY